MAFSLSFAATVVLYLLELMGLVVVDGGSGRLKHPDLGVVDELSTSCTVFKISGVFGSKSKLRALIVLFELYSFKLKHLRTVGLFISGVTTAVIAFVLMEEVINELMLFGSFWVGSSSSSAISSIYSSSIESMEFEWKRLVLLRRVDEFETKPESIELQEVNVSFCGLVSGDKSVGIDGNPVCVVWPMLSPSS